MRSGGAERPSYTNMGCSSNAVSLGKDAFYFFCLWFPWGPLSIPLLLFPHIPSCTSCSNPRSPVKHVRWAKAGSFLLIPTGLCCICYSLPRAEVILLSQKCNLCGNLTTPMCFLCPAWPLVISEWTLSWRQLGGVISSEILNLPLQALPHKMFFL